MQKSSKTRILVNFLLIVDSIVSPNSEKSLPNPAVVTKSQKTEVWRSTLKIIQKKASVFFFSTRTSWKTSNSRRWSVARASAHWLQLKQRGRRLAGCLPLQMANFPFSKCSCSSCVKMAGRRRRRRKMRRVIHLMAVICFVFIASTIGEPFLCLEP